MNELVLVLSFVLSLLLTLYGTPIARRVALRYRILDLPDGHLKNQAEPVPYLGGMIIYFAFIAPVSLMFPFDKKLLGILFASSILLIVGLFDDLKAMTPLIKFLFQVIATFILVRSGIQIELTFLPAWMNIAVSFIWIIIMINAVNIIDIMDGLAPSVVLAASLTVFVISLYNKNLLISILSISLSGALLGFLKFNWAPASIYLGDSGSMFIGMVIGCLSILGDYSIYNDLAFFCGFFIMAIPLFDTTYVILIRLLQGRSPFFGSPDHFALRLKRKFSLSPGKTVRVIVFIQLLLTAIVFLNFYTGPTVTIVSMLATVILLSLFGLWLADVKME